MESINYFLSGGLNDEHIKRIHENALRVICEIGLEVCHEEVLKLVSGQEGVKIKKNRIYFEADLVEKSITQHTQLANEPSDKIKVLTGGLSLNSLDLETGAIRPAVSKDLVEMTKLADALDMEGYAPVMPHDIPGKLGDLALYKICWENSRNIGGGNISSAETAEYIYKMSQVVNKPFLFRVWMIPPLKFDDRLFDIVLHFAKKDIPITVNLGTLNSTGTTTPIFIPGAYVQALAEVLGGVTMYSLINPKGTVIFDDTTCGIEVNPFDMRYTNYVYGSAENALMVMVRLQLQRFYKLPLRAKCFLTMSQQPDAQAAAERGMLCLLSILAGAKELASTGRISEDEIFSGEQLVIDRELVDYGLRILKGFEFSEEKLGLDIIKEAAITKDYLGHKSTLESYREYWMPTLFEHQLLDQWRQKGSRSLRDRARQIAKDKIASHEFELDSDAKKELDAIYTKAKQELS